MGRAFVPNGTADTCTQVRVGWDADPGNHGGEIEIEDTTKQ